MNTDFAVLLVRTVLMQAMLLSLPVLLAAAAISLIMSLLQTLTGVQEQTLTAVPRLIVAAVVSLLALPWTAHRMAFLTVQLWGDLHRYLA